MLMIVKDAQRILLSEEKRYLYDKKLADKKPTTEENKPKTKESYMQEPENNFLVNNPDIMGISFFLLSWLFIFLGSNLKKTFEVGAFISGFAAFFCLICFSLLCHKENCKEQERKTSELKNKKDEIVSKIKDYIKEDIEILAPYYSNEVCCDRYGNELQDKGFYGWWHTMRIYIETELSKSPEIAVALKYGERINEIYIYSNNKVIGKQAQEINEITNNNVTLTREEIMDIINIIVVEALEIKRR